VINITVKSRALGMRGGQAGTLAAKNQIRQTDPKNET
jgi:hypothetical protein